LAKILHIITRLDRGGSAYNTLLSCRFLAGKYDMILAHGLSVESRMTREERKTVDREMADAQKRGARFEAAPSLVQRIQPIRDIQAFFALWKLIRREKPDIVHTHTSKAGFLGRWAAKMAGVPHIVHTPHGHVFYGHFGPVGSRFFLYLEKITSPITEKMIALTEAERNDYRTYRVANERQLVTIHSGVTISRFMNPNAMQNEKRAALGMDEKGPVVGTVGWLLPIKGPLHLLKAMGKVWQDHPNCRLVYVGKGDLEPALRNEVHRMCASDRVHFLGWRKDIPAIMALFDIFVLPSLNEGMGRVVVEAMAAGKPVVASRVGGILDLIKHGENGFLVEPADPAGLARAIIRLLENKTLRERMGRKGRETAPRYGVESMIEKLDALYSSILGLNMI